LKADIKIGEDDQTKIDFETADEIHLYAANAEQVYVADGIFGPQTDSDVDLGTTGVRWKNAYIDTITTTGASQLETLGVGAAKDLGVALHVKSGDSGASVDGGGDELVVESSGAGGISILTGNTSTGKLAFGDDGAANKFSVNYDHSTDLMKISTAAAVAISMDQTGAVTMPLQPSFHVTNAAQNNLGTDASATITFSTEVFDANADFNVSNYTFTAPVTGKYMLTFHMTLNAMDSASPFTYAHLDTSNREYYSWYDNNLELSGDAGYVTFHISVLADMDANDTALGKVFIGGGTAQTDLATATNTWFTGFLAC